MCRPIDCSTCDKQTWIGCGLHIPRAMSAIPKENWCTCLHKNGETSEFPPKVGEGIKREENQE